MIRLPFELAPLFRMMLMYSVRLLVVEYMPPIGENTAPFVPTTYDEKSRDGMLPFQSSACDVQTPCAFAR